MAISEKDIFQSLMKDPNHAYNGIEKVWAEAQQRARQFRNNEKALSLGLEKSAMEKFSDFVTKADPTTFDNWFIDPTNNKRQNAALLKEVQKEVKEAGLTLGALHSNLGSTSLTDNSFSEKVFQVPNANGAWVPDDRENNASEYIKKHAQQLHDIYWGIENTIKGNELSPEQKRVLNQLHSIGNLAGGNSIGDTSSATDAFNLEDPVAFKKHFQIGVMSKASQDIVDALYKMQTEEEGQLESGDQAPLKYGGLNVDALLGKMGDEDDYQKYWDQPDREKFSEASTQPPPPPPEGSVTVSEDFINSIPEYVSASLDGIDNPIKSGDVQISDLKAYRNTLTDAYLAANEEVQELRNKDKESWTTNDEGYFNELLNNMVALEGQLKISHNFINSRGQTFNSYADLVRSNIHTYMEDGMDDDDNRDVPQQGPLAWADMFDDNEPEEGVNAHPTWSEIFLNRDNRFGRSRTNTVELFTPAGNLNTTANGVTRFQNRHTAQVPTPMDDFHAGINDALQTAGLTDLTFRVQGGDTSNLRDALKYYQTDVPDDQKWNIDGFVNWLQGDTDEVNSVGVSGPRWQVFKNNHHISQEPVTLPPPGGGGTPSGGGTGTPTPTGTPVPPDLNEILMDKSNYTWVRNTDDDENLRFGGRWEYTPEAAEQLRSIYGDYLTPHRGARLYRQQRNMIGANLADFNNNTPAPKEERDREQFISEIMDKEFPDGWNQDDLDVEQTRAFNHYFRMNDKALATHHDNNVIKVEQAQRKKDREEREKREEEKRKEEEMRLSDEERQDLVDKIKEAYKTLFDTELPDDAVKRFLNRDVVNDQTLKNAYEQHINKLAESKAKEAEALQKHNANDLSRFAPLSEKENLTWPDILSRGRALIRHQHGNHRHMSDKTLTDFGNLQEEANQLASQVGYDLDAEMEKDKAMAKERGVTYGSEEWWHQANEETHRQMKNLEGLTKFVEEGGDALRANPNYKPNLVVEYVDTGDGKIGEGKFVDLRTMDYMDGVRFDNDNHVIFGDPTDDMTAEEAFYSKFRGDSLPVNTDQVPMFGDSPDNPNLIPGWYHPESGAWINPYRYHELHDISDGSSDFIVPFGSMYQGKNKGSVGDPQFSFAQYPEGVSDMGFFLDSSGNIHANSWNGQSQIDPDAPQTINDVVHHWYSQQIAAKQQSFIAGENQVNTITPIKSALERRLGYPVQRGRDLRGRETIAPEELDMDRWQDVYPSGWGRKGRGRLWMSNEFRQAFMDIAEYPKSPLIGWAMKLLIGGTSQMDQVIRRHRDDYNTEMRVQNSVKQQREAAQQSYVSPGERNARKDDLDKLNLSLGNEQRAIGRQIGGIKAANYTSQAAFDSDKNRLQAQQNQYLEQIDSLKGKDYLIDNDWDHINNLYTNHFYQPKPRDPTEAREMGGMSPIPAYESEVPKGGPIPQPLV